MEKREKKRELWKGRSRCFAKRDDSFIPIHSLCRSYNFSRNSQVIRVDDKKKVKQQMVAAKSEDKYCSPVETSATYAVRSEHNAGIEEEITSVCRINI